MVQSDSENHHDHDPVCVHVNNNNQHAHRSNFPWYYSIILAASQSFSSMKHHTSNSVIVESSLLWHLSHIYWLQLFSQSAINHHKSGSLINNLNDINLFLALFHTAVCSSLCFSSLFNLLPCALYLNDFLCSNSWIILPFSLIRCTQNSCLLIHENNHFFHLPHLQFLSFSAIHHEQYLTSTPEVSMILHLGCHI